MANFWRVATGNWDALLSWSQIGSGGAAGVGNPTAADNAIFDTNTPAGTHTVNVSATCLNLDLDKPASGTLTFAGSSALAISGSLIVRSATNITRSYTGAITFNGTTSGLTIQSNGLTFASAVTFDDAASSAEWTLQDAFLTTGSITFTDGIFTTGNNSVTSASMASTGASVRTMNLGSSTWTVTGTGSAWTTLAATNLTINYGTSTIVSNGAGARSIRPTVAINNLSISNSGNITFDPATVIDGNLDFTGATGTWLNSSPIINGSITLGSGMSVGAGTSVLTMQPTSGTKIITSSGVQWSQPITINATPGVTVRLADSHDMVNKTLTLTQGILDVNGQTLTCGVISGSNANTRSVGLGTGGTINLTSTGTVWDFGTSTNFTFTGTGAIKITANSASVKTFAGGGITTYQTLWISDGSTGEPRITGNNTFYEIKVDAGRSIYPTAGTTQHVTLFTAPGTSGNGITVTSAAGSTSTHALVKDGGGTIECDWLTISHSVATPSNTWYAGPNSTNSQATASAGSGWIFTILPAKLGWLNPRLTPCLPVLPKFDTAPAGAISPPAAAAPTGISGIAWFEPRDNDKRPVRSVEAVPAFAPIPVASATTPISGSAWSQREEARIARITRGDIAPAFPVQVSQIILPGWFAVPQPLYVPARQIEASVAAAPIGSASVIRFGWLQRSDDFVKGKAPPTDGQISVFLAPTVPASFGWFASIPAPRAPRFLRPDISSAWTPAVPAATPIPPNAWWHEQDDDKRSTLLWMSIRPASVTAVFAGVAPLIGKVRLSGSRVSPIDLSGSKADPSLEGSVDI